MHPGCCPTSQPSTTAALGVEPASREAARRVADALWSPAQSGHGAAPLALPEKKGAAAQRLVEASWAAEVSTVFCFSGI